MGKTKTKWIAAVPLLICVCGMGMIIYSPSTIVLRAGTIACYDIVQEQNGWRCREHCLWIEGQCNAAGVFDVSIPQVNGFLRGFVVKQTDSQNFPMGNATVDMDATLGPLDRSHLTIPCYTAGTQVMSGGALVAPIGTSDTFSSSAFTPLCGPLRIKIGSATANGKFQLAIVVRLGI